MTRALITGGAGFIGFHLAKKLVERNIDVDLVDNFSRGAHDDDLKLLLGMGQVRLLQADLLRPDGFKDLPASYDYIYHFAALLGVANVLRRPYEVLRDNVTMLTGALDFARTNSALKRLVFASTSEVYAGTLQHFDLPIPTPESTPLAVADLEHPRTSYMLSKIYGEALCHQSGLPFTIIRPHNVFGPRMGMAHAVPELLKKAYFEPAGASIEVFSVDHMRTFCYIDDAVELIWRAAEAPATAKQTLNIGAPGPMVRIGDVAELVFKTVAKGQRAKPMPETPGSPAKRCPDMEKTAHLTGYRASVELADGIARTYEWYRRHVFEA